MKISVIIPTFNDSDLLIRQLQELQGWRQAGHEVIVADAGRGETDRVSDRGLADRFLMTDKGRALQMNEAARLASGDVLLFLHADTRLPGDACTLIAQVMENPEVAWGRFDVRLTGTPWYFRIIERAISVRSHLTGIVTGDQGLFVRRSTFERLSGYASIPLMEDVEISRRLRRISWPARIKEPVVTSSRRWEQHGVIHTVLLMWWLRALYSVGVSPGKLARKYYN